MIHYTVMPFIDRRWHFFSYVSFDEAILVQWNYLSLTQRGKDFARNFSQANFYDISTQQPKKVEQEQHDSRISTIIFT